MDKESRRQFCTDRISRAEQVIGELSKSNGWTILLQDHQRTKQQIDDSWHLIQDPIKLGELRVTKLAIQSVLDTLRNYEHDLKLAKKELYELDNPDKVIKKDYDAV